ncbi:MMPL family transporter [Nonomuraea thailandensis]
MGAYGDNTAAVAAGLQQTGGVITSAALLLLVVIGAFSTAGITIVKLLGVGMFVAIVVDATLVRALLVPASMRLMGGANWWLPRSWRAFHRRIELREAAPSPALAPAPAPALPALKSTPAPASTPTSAAVPPAVTVNGRSAVFGADTDPVPLPAPPRPAAPGGRTAAKEGEQPERKAGWVRVADRRAREVRALPGGGWTWVEVDE